jgi:proteic killer suppression protein
VILGFRHKGLRRFFETGDVRGIPAARRGRIGVILHRLQWSRGPADMDLPGLRLHPLRGHRAGSWAVDVSGNWRIVFRFDGEDAADVDLTDYH